MSKKFRRRSELLRWTVFLWLAFGIAYAAIPGGEGFMFLGLAMSAATFLTSFIVEAIERQEVRREQETQAENEPVADREAET